LFRNSLGLLVEQGPGLYSFLHLTLAEYLAARELVRSGELEQIAGNEQRAFLPESREMLLLAAGELGIIRADDERLDGLVELLLASAARREETPGPDVPSVLAGLLADDPGLSKEEAERLIHALIPTWWFARNYPDELLQFVAGSAYQLLRERPLQGRFAKQLQNRFEQFYGLNAPAALLKEKLPKSLMAIHWLSSVLQAAEVDNGPMLLCYLREGHQGDREVKIALSGVSTVALDEERLVVHIHVSRFLDQQVRTNGVSLVLSLQLVEIKKASAKVSDWRLVLLGEMTIPWNQTRVVRPLDGTQVVVEAQLASKPEYLKVAPFLPICGIMLSK
jgi:hypothetical protein